MLHAQERVQSREVFSSRIDRIRRVFVNTDKANRLEMIATGNQAQLKEVRDVTIQVINQKLHQILKLLGPGLHISWTSMSGHFNELKDHLLDFELVGVRQGAVNYPPEIFSKMRDIVNALGRNEKVGRRPDANSYGELIGELLNSGSQLMRGIALSGFAQSSLEHKQVAFRRYLKDIEIFVKHFKNVEEPEKSTISQSGLFKLEDIQTLINSMSEGFLAETRNVDFQGHHENISTVKRRVDAALEQAKKQEMLRPTPESMAISKIWIDALQVRDCIFALEKALTQLFSEPGYEGQPNFFEDFERTRKASFFDMPEEKAK